MHTPKNAELLGVLKLACKDFLTLLKEKRHGCAHWQAAMGHNIYKQPNKNNFHFQMKFGICLHKFGMCLTKVHCRIPPPPRPRILA